MDSLVLEGVNKFGKNNCFQVVTPNRGLFVFADTTNDMQLWVNEIRGSITKLKIRAKQSQAKMCRDMLARKATEGVDSEHGMGGMGGGDDFDGFESNVTAVDGSADGSKGEVGGGSDGAGGAGGGEAYDVTEMGVKALRAKIEEAGLRHTDCVEKSELRDRCTEALAVLAIAAEKAKAQKAQTAQREEEEKGKGKGKAKVEQSHLQLQLQKHLNGGQGAQGESPSAGPGPAAPTALSEMTYKLPFSNVHITVRNKVDSA